MPPRQDAHPNPRAAAEAAGLAGARAGRVVDVGQSHSVHRVEAEGQAVVVKMVGTTAAGRSLAHEAFVYRLASWQPGLAAVLPEALLIDEARGVIVMQAAPPEAVGSSWQMSGSLPPPEVCAALGRTLGILHTATSGLAIPFPGSAGVLDLPGSTADDIELRNAVPLALSVGSDAVLGPHLKASRAGWAPSCLVHADVKWDNCLVDDSAGAPTVRLIDWEMAGWGDPAWDVAAALAQLSSLTCATGRPSTLHQGELLRAYPDQLRGDISERLPGFWAARVVHLALECAEAGAEAVAQSLLEHARDLVRRQSEIADGVSAWSR